MEILERYSLFDSELPTTTGVYRIYNLVSGKQYIGSARATSTKYYLGFNGRFNIKFTGHRFMLKTNAHHCIHLQNSYNQVVKSGVDPNEVFQIQIIEYVEPDFCLSREQWYLDNCENKYNCSTIASGSNANKGRKKSPEELAGIKEIKRLKDIEKSGAYVVVDCHTGDITHVPNLYFYCEEKGYSYHERKSVERDIAKGRDHGSIWRFMFFEKDSHIAATIRRLGRDRVRMINGSLDFFNDGPDFWPHGDPRPKLQR